MNNKLLKKLFTISVILFFISSSTVSAETKDVQLNLNFSNLADPGEDHYEGWLIVDGKAISTGKFTIDSKGDLYDLNDNLISNFNITEVDLDMATEFVLTLELKGDTDSTPSSIKPFKGVLNAEKTSASISQNIGKDFTSVSGKYILATPTNGANTDENSGIWYLDPSSGTPKAGLNLPDLTGTDWIYEGWVVVNGIPITTGTFETVTGLDDSDPYSSNETAPPFPGEDFLVDAPSGSSFPLDLAGEVTAITIEPRKDNSEAPFQFHPLAADIPNEAMDHVVYDMHEEVSKFATGMLTIEELNSNTLPGFGVLQLFMGIIVLISLSSIIKRKK